MSGVSARPDDLDHYHDVNVQPRSVVLTRANSVGVALDGLAYRRFDGLEVVPGTADTVLIRQLVVALGDFDEWLASVAANFRAADGNGQIPSWALGEIAETFVGRLTGVGWPAPWSDVGLLSSDLVILTVGVSALFDVEGQYGYRVDRYADGTVTVTRLESVGVGQTFGFEATASLGLGGASVGIGAEAVARYLVSVGGAETWRVPADEVDDLIINRILADLDVDGVVAAAGWVAQEVPDSAGITFDVPWVDVPWIDAPTISASVPGGEAIAALGALATRLATYQPPSPVRTAATIEVEAEATYREQLVGDFGASIGIEAGYETIDYLGGWTADRVSIVLDGELDGGFHELAGAVGVSVERRVDPTGAGHSLVVTWTTQVNDAVRTSTVTYDLQGGPSQSLGDSVWRQLIDPSQLSRGLEGLVDLVGMEELTRTDDTFAVTERQYGPAADLAVLIGRAGGTAQVTTIALDAI